MAVATCGQPGGRQRRRRHLVADALVDEVVARVLQQQRTPPARATRPRVGSSSPAAWRSSVDLPAPLRPISATRSPGAKLQVDAAQDRGAAASSCQAPSNASAARGARARPGARPARRLGSVCAGAASISPWPRSVARASLHRHRRRAQPGQREQPRARRLQRGRVVARPGEERRAAARRRRSRRRRIATTRSAAAGSARGGARRARSPSPTPRSAAAAARSARRPRRDRAARSARRAARSARPPGERRAERDALQLAARQLVRGAVEQRARCRARAPPPPPRARPRPARRRGSPAGRRARRAPPPITTCVSGSWNSVPATAARSPGPVLARVQAAATTRPANVPPWKCGTSPVAARSSVDLPDADRPASTTNSPGLDVRETPRARPLAPGYV